MSATLTAIKTDLRSAWRALFRDEIAELRAAHAELRRSVMALESLMHVRLDGLREHMSMNDLSMSQQIRDHEDRMLVVETRGPSPHELATHVAIVDFNQRLIALETKPQPVAPPKEEENDPARGWQRQRDRAEEGERKRAS